MTFDPARPLPTSSLAAAVLASVGGAAILAAAARLAGLESTAGSVQLVVALQTIATVGLLGGATLFLSRWRVDGGAPSAYLAAATAAYALGAVPLSSVVATVAPRPAADAMDEATRLAITVVVAALVLAAATYRDCVAVPARALVVRVVASASLGVLVLVVLDRLAVSTGAGSSRPEQVQLVLDSAAALVWLGLAVSAWRLRSRSEWALRTIPLSIGFAVVSVLDAAAADTVGSPTHLAAMLLAACLAVLVVVCAMSALAQAIEVARRRAAATMAELDEAAASVLARDAWREELSHDAVNAISGLRAALSTMSRYDDRLDTPSARRLREAALAEVTHLEHLVARSPQDHPVVFDVAEVISSVVETRRAGGLSVEVDDDATGPEGTPGEGLALGRPGDVATVLHNLLINVDVHAPASRVRVAVSRGVDQIGIEVSDDGPGISPADRERVFERGVSGAANPRTGLGLYVARELMREQAGDLELVGSAAGCIFVASLPAASTPGSHLSSIVAGQAGAFPSTAALEPPLELRTGVRG